MKFADMPKYNKIQTVFLRDPSNKFRTLLYGEFAKPEFAYLAHNQWTFTEKVDGTNIRLSITGDNLVIGAKTDNSQVPTPLLPVLQGMFPPDLLRSVFDTDDFVLFGEGYGDKIQKAGKKYKPDGLSFVLFDVLVGGWWLERVSVIDVAEKLNIKAVPTIGSGTLYDMVATAQAGFTSLWGDFTAEGIVARPETPLLGRDGKPIITKIKYKDFAR